MNIYKGYTAEEQENIASQFLLGNWSYSAVSAFARNEKAFEMNYIFGEFSKSSASAVAGKAYHEALAMYFARLKNGKPTMDIVEMEAVAFAHIDDVPNNAWRLQSSTPSVEDCKLKASKTVSTLLLNFLREVTVYTEGIKRVIDVELYCDEYLTVNGVDIPIPCHAYIDLIVETVEGKKAVLDHKSKSVYTPDEEVALTIGKQAITYALSYEEKTGDKIDEVWFIENKISTNKSGDPQLKLYKVELSASTRAIYESLLYEPLKRMIEAINNPDYIYLMNDADNMTDKAELYSFWARTMVSSIDDFNVADDKKELVEKRLKKIKDSSTKMITPSVIKKFKQNADAFIKYDMSNKDMTPEQKIEHSLRSFGIIANVAHKFEGFSSDTYLLEIGAGVSVNSIYTKRLDLANALNVSNVRLSPEMVVYEGVSYVSVECSKKREKDLLFDTKLAVDNIIPLGKDNIKRMVMWDLDNHSTPHMLVCGATGSGKTEMLITILEYARRNEHVRKIVILDPKFEFIRYAKKGIKVFNEIEDIENCVEALVDDMNERVKLKTKELTLVIFDEFADAYANAKTGNDLKIWENVEVGIYKNGMPKMARQMTGMKKSLEENIRILLQKGRSTGFRIVAATQRASAKIITGDAKVNFPVQVVFRVPKEIDSKVVIDEAGGEALQGYGDGLIKSPQYQETIRFQAFYKPNSLKA